MSRPSDPDLGTVESALLFLSRDPASLEWLLSRFFPPSTMTGMVSKGGKRKKGRNQPSQALADAVVGSEGIRRSVAEGILSALPVGPLAPEKVLKQHSELMKVECLGASLRKALTGGEEDWTRAKEYIDRWKDMLEEAAEPSRPEKGPAAEEKTPPKEGDGKLQRQLRNLEGRLVEADRERVKLRDSLGREGDRRRRVEEALDEARAKAQEEHLRAAENKRKLEGATRPGEREAALGEEMEGLRKSERMAVKKLILVEEERDDLRACLEDHEKFSSLEEEVVPSFRDRPLIAEENVLAESLGAAAAEGRAFKVLVVGGGEPQLRHLEKLKEYAEVLGFWADWRMAEYVSWHKHMDKLERDMRTQFDAMVILHWNRTTFTRKCRDICNKVGQKPCITCHYEGFTNLRASLRECLGQLLRRKA